VFSAVFLLVFLFYHTCLHDENNAKRRRTDKVPITVALPTAVSTTLFDLLDILRAINTPVIGVSVLYVVF